MDGNLKNPLTICAVMLGVGNNIMMEQRNMRGRTKLNQALIVLDCLLLLATLAFIWSNSMQSVETSQDQSRTILNVIKPLLETIVGRDNVTDHLVRKLAHFIEFSALGIGSAMFLVLCKRVRLQPIMNCLFAGLVVAIIDETVQIVSGRGSQVQDVLLDFAGVIFGLIATILIYLIIAHRKRDYNQTKQWREWNHCVPLLTFGIKP